MKKILLTTFIAIALCSCGRKHSIPAMRLEQPSGNFSFVTPDGWFQQKLMGMEFIIVSTKSDYGINPNIFVDFVNPSSDLDHAVTRLTELYKNNYPDYQITERHDFITTSGLHGIKISAKRTNQTRLPLATYQYLIKGNDRVFAMTCTCVDAVKEKYEPIFDQAMSTLEAKN